MSILEGKIKNFLYKKKRQAYHIPKRYFQNIFWENNSDNLYYGHYDILKKYSNTIFPYKINGEVQHGWSPDHGIPYFEYHMQFKDHAFYVFNELNYAKCKKLGFTNTKIIGAPFIYIKNQYKKNNNNSNNSIILFPSHTHEFGILSNPVKSFEKYLNDFKGIRRFFNRITVVLYWKDYLNQNIKNLFENFGAKVISNGHRDNNPNYLYNFIKIVQEHEYVSSDHFSSAIFYSLYLKKKTFIYGNQVIKDLKFVNGSENKASKNLETYSRLYPELIWENYNHKSHSEISEFELGLDYKKSPKYLRELFGWSIGKLFAFSKNANYLI